MPAASRNVGKKSKRKVTFHIEEKTTGQSKPTEFRGNRFDVLSQKDAVDSPSRKPETWPALTGSLAPRRLLDVKTGYAEAVARAKKENECARANFFEIGDFDEETDVPGPPASSKPISQRSWSDDSDWSDFSDNGGAEMVEYWEQAEDSW